MTQPAPQVPAASLVCPLETRDIVDRVVLFCEKLSDISYYTYQSLFTRRIVESVLENDGDTITGLWSRQCGKTEDVATVCIGLAVLMPVLSREFPDDPRFKPFKKGFLVGVYAPIQDQANISFSRMRDKINSEVGEAILADEELDVQVVTNRGDTLTFSNGSIIISKSASPDTQIEGKTHHLVICEEAQKLTRAKVEKEIRPMLAATNGTMVKIGTAWESRGGFHVSITHNEEERKRGGKRNHFEFPYDIVIAEKRRAYDRDGNPFHLNYEKFVANEIRRLGGTDSDEFKMNFRCLWQESRVIAIRPDVFEAAMDTTLTAGARRGGFQVAGLDIGKVTDSTVLTVMNVDLAHPIRNPFTLPDAEEEKQIYYSKYITDWLELGGSFEGSAGQYRKLIEYLEMTSVQVLCIDCTSIGDPVFERIEAMIGGTVICVPFRFGPVSKSELYKYYLQEVNSGRVRYAASKQTRERFEYRKFLAEHLDLDKEDRGGYVICRAPEGGHDDYPDSAALACWAEKVAADQVMPEVQVTTAPWGHGGSESWRGEKVQDEQDSAVGAKSILEMMARSGGTRASRYQRGRR